MHPRHCRCVDSHAVVTRGAFVGKLGAPLPPLCFYTGNAPSLTSSKEIWSSKAPVLFSFLSPHAIVPPLRFSLAMIILDIFLYCCWIVDEGWLSSRDKRKYGSKFALLLLMAATRHSGDGKRGRPWEGFFGARWLNGWNGFATGGAPGAVLLRIRDRCLRLSWWRRNQGF